MDPRPKRNRSIDDRLPRRRCLLVADRSSPSCDLLDLVTERCGRSGEIFVLVSRHRTSVLVPDPSLTSGSGTRTGRPMTVDDERFHIADARLASFIRSLERAGLIVSGEVVFGNALKAARRAIRASSFDEVLVIDHEFRRESGSGSARPTSRSADSADSVGSAKRSWRSVSGRPHRDMAERLGRACPVPITRLPQWV